MSIFGKLLKTTIDVVTVPVNVAQDVITLGGALTEQEEPYTVQKAKRLIDDLEEVRDEANEL